MAVHGAELLSSLLPPALPSVPLSVNLGNLIAADDHLVAIKHVGNAAEVTAARCLLQVAVDDARDAEVGWGQIGDALGLRRGNAYQKFRKRATAAGSGT